MVEEGRLSGNHNMRHPQKLVIASLKVAQELQFTPHTTVASKFTTKQQHN